MERKSTCKRCGLTVRQFVLVNGRGKKRTAWCALIKGVWTEACPATIFLDRAHKANE